MDERVSVIDGRQAFLVRLFGEFIASSTVRPYSMHRDLQLQRHFFLVMNQIQHIVLSYIINSAGGLHKWVLTQILCVLM